MKKKIISAVLMTAITFSAQASVKIATRAVAGIAGIASSGYVIVNETVEKSFYESAQAALNSATHFLTKLFQNGTQEVIVPLAHNATGKNQFLRTAATGLVIAATIGFLINKTIEKHDAQKTQSHLEKLKNIRIDIKEADIPVTKKTTLESLAAGVKSNKGEQV